MGTFNPFNKHDWDREVGDKVKKGFDKVADVTEDTFNKATNEVKNQIKGTAMSFIDDIKNIGNKVEKEINDVANKAKKEVEKTAKKAGSDIHGGLDWARRQADEKFKLVENEVTDLANKAKDEVEEQGKKVIKDVEKELYKIKDGVLSFAEKALDEVSEAVMSEAFKKYLEMLIKIARLGPDQLNFGVEAVAVSISFSFDVSDDLDILESWIRKPPKNSNDILELVKALAPDSLEIGLSGGLNVVVEVSGHATGTWSKDKAIEGWSDIINAIK